MDEQLEEEMEYLEDENQCLKDELDVSNTELKAAKELTVYMEEVKRLLAYFIFVDERGLHTSSLRADCIPPAILANKMGFGVRYAKSGSYYEILLPSRGQPSLKSFQQSFHQSFGPPPTYDMDRAVIPNVELTKI